MKPNRTRPASGPHVGDGSEAVIGRSAPPRERTDAVRKSLMAKLRSLREMARAQAAADAEVVAARFRKQDRPAMRRFAAASFAHGEVAEQFPMLAYTIALELNGAERSAAAHEAIFDGATLSRVARAAGVPMWTRIVMAQACEDPGGPLPDGASFACRIAPVLQKRLEAGNGDSDGAGNASRNELRGMLRLIANANAGAGEDLALWLAHRMPANSLAPDLPSPLRMLVLWYLLSRHRAGLGRELMHTPWRSELSMETALRAVKNFARRVEMELVIGPAGLRDPWFPRGTLMEVEIVPLLTSTDIRAEAKRNCNCLDWYGQRLATNEVRLFSMRTADGRCLANVELSPSETEPKVPRIAQIKAPNNEPASAQAVSIAEIWLHRQIRDYGLPNMKRCRPPAPDALRWREIVAPLAKAAELPPWAERVPNSRELFQLELEFTMLSCRLHTRGWRFA